MTKYLRMIMAGVMLALAAPAAMAAEKSFQVPAEAKDPDLMIYTSEGTRGYRVIWLAEELGIPYKAMFTPRNGGESFKKIRELSPLMGQSPLIVYKGTQMLESGGILAYLMSQFSQGRLQPKKADTNDYMDYLQWLHFAEGSALPVMFAEIRGGRYANIGPGREKRVQGPAFGVNTEKTMAYIEAYLAKHPYFGGQTFSAADIMMHFIAELGPDPNYFSIDLAKYPHFQAWVKKVESRPGFIRAMDVALPDHRPCPRLPNCTPVTTKK
jgi:glutathione S-transferase